MARESLEQPERIDPQSGGDEEKAQGDEPKSEKDAEKRVMVTWEGDDDPMNPRSMSKARKWLVVIIVSASSLCVSVLSNAPTHLLSGRADSVNQNVRLFFVHVDVWPNNGRVCLFGDCRNARAVSLCRRPGHRANGTWAAFRSISMQWSSDCSSLADVCSSMVGDRYISQHLLSLQSG